MKKAVFLILAFVFLYGETFAQNVAIGTAVPHSSARLEISSSNSGLLIPRLTTTEMSNISFPAKGLMILDTVTNQLMINMGTTLLPDWQPVVIKSGWALNGNTGLGAGQFIGTADNSVLRFKVNGLKAGLVDHLKKNVVWGTNAANNLSANASENLILGDSALFTSTSAITGNTVLGYSAQLLSNAFVMKYNTIVGYNAGRGNIGSWTTLLGTDAGRSNLAQGSVFVGSAAGYSNTSGYDNSFIGNNAGRENKTGLYNTYLGSYAGQLSLSSFNTFLGALAGYYNTSGKNNFYAGSFAGFNSTTGNSNLGIGTAALFSNSSASNLVAIGDSALYNSLGTDNPTDGINNTAIGAKSMYANLFGAGNTAIGYNSMKANTHGYNNIAIGSDALLANTTGIYNTATGFRSIYSNTASGYLSAYGAWSLYSNTTGEKSTAMGYQTLYSNTTGFYNSAMGYQSMFTNTDGRWNAALGYQSLYSNNLGNFNVAVGSNTLYSSNGSSNTAIGNAALYKSNGNDNTGIGAYADVANSAIFNAAAIGSGAVAGQSNMMSFGNPNTAGWGFARSTIVASAALQVGYTFGGNGNGAYLSTGGTWTNASDINLKENITEVDPVTLLEKISGLGIYSWKYRGTQETHVGPMAQEFKKIFGLGAADDDKTISTIDPSGISLAAIKALYAQNKVLQDKINTIQQQMDEVLKRLEQAEKQQAALRSTSSQ